MLGLNPHDDGIEPSDARIELRDAGIEPKDVGIEPSAGIEPSSLDWPNIWIELHEQLTEPQVLVKLTIARYFFFNRPQQRDCPLTGEQDEG
jgi:hypothetical protein